MRFQLGKLSARGSIFSSQKNFFIREIFSGKAREMFAGMGTCWQSAMGLSYVTQFSSGCIHSIVQFGRVKIKPMKKIIIRIGIAVAVLVVVGLVVLFFSLNTIVKK